MLVSSLTGACTLATGNRRGLAFFDATPKGFWNSFFAAAIAAPTFAALIAAGLEAAPIGPDPFRYAAIQLIAYIIGWTAFPLAMFHLCNALGWQDRYLRYVVAYNWAQVIQGAALVMALGLSRLPIIPHGLGDALMLSAIGGTAVYQWFVARVALDVSPLAAIAVLSVDATISVAITLIAGLLLFVPAPV